MTKQKSTKRALLLSALSLLMCVSMLIGSTFAWFTDSVTSGKNQIIAGNLDVELYYTYDAAVAADIDSTAWVKVTPTTDVFGYSLWEPGYTKVAYFKVVNEGTLAMNYRLSADVYEEDAGTNQAGTEFLLSDYIKTALVSVGATREQILSQTGTSLTGKFVMADSLTDPDHATELEAGKSAVVGLAIWMPTSVGNAANHNGDAPSITFGINLVATQKTFEEDSFDDQYDKDAKYPLGKPTYVTKTVSGIKTVVGVPAEAPEGDYELEMSAVTFENNAGKTTMSFDMSLLRDQQEVSGSGITYPVTVELPHPFLEIVDIKHNGESVGAFQYDPNTLTVSFTTNGFSPFAIEYKDYIDPSFPLEYEVVDAERNKFAITQGIFVGKNPSEFDVSLAETDSEYIVVDYVKDGVTYYAVSERATTLIVAADDAAAFLDGRDVAYYSDVLQKNVSGNLWKAFVNDSRAYKLGAKTVYILPGTYNEGTTLTIATDMDVIGLGNADSVKIVKITSSSSNRHLFNCNGTSADYIQVTLRNLHLDATAKTENSKDNAAVQSIRRTKVKCYDLKIVKGSGWDAAAFYVNGNNAVNGVKPTAYLYAENCALNTTRSFGVVSTNGTYKFYHSGLTYGGTAYTQNANSILNRTMDVNDWIWD